MISSVVCSLSQGGSSLDLSPSDSCGSGGTYMWDEEGLEPLGGAATTGSVHTNSNTTHPIGSFDSDINSIVSPLVQTNVPQFRATVLDIFRCFSGPIRLIELIQFRAIKTGVKKTSRPDSGTSYIRGEGWGYLTD